MGSTSTAGRVDWVDYAKGICIVFVVMMHSVLGVEEAAGRLGWMHAVTDFAKPFRMPDFFLISGLFLARVIVRDWRSFADRRIVHFAYFYVLWLVIQFAFKAPGFVAENGAEDTAWLFVSGLFWEPFGTLWFIWMLPVFALTVRLTRRVPAVIVFGIAAGLEIAPIATGHTVIDEFAGRFVYFYAGYLFAPYIFQVAAWARRNGAAALAGLLLWGLLNATFVHFGLAELPFVSLGLGFAGAGAVILTAVLLARLPWSRFIRFLGQNSIVVYLAFFLPMAVSRAVLLRLDLLDVGTTGLVVTACAVIGALMIWWAAMRFGARFLFERPAWARIERPAASGGLVAAE